MPHIQDLMTISLSIDVNGFIKDGDKETRYHEGHEEAFSCGLDDAQSTANLLHEIADAIEEGRLYGWMMQDHTDSMVKGGDLREETQSEMFDRIRDAYAEQPVNANDIGKPVVMPLEVQRSGINSEEWMKMRDDVEIKLHQRIERGGIDLTDDEVLSKLTK